MSPRSEENNQQIRDERREEILQAALKVFARKGLAAAKITDIANATGMSHGLVYHYFNSKDEIFTELVKRALGGSLGVIEYASQLTCSPWEKIRIMTEMIFSGSYEGDSLYYYHIMIQAFTSEAIPEAVKELVNQNVPSYSDLFIPILEEGQRLGQIAPDDPQKLSVAYYSLIQGMAVIYMQHLQAGFTISPPDVDMVLRLLKNPDGQNEPESISAQSRNDYSPVRSHKVDRQTFGLPVARESEGGF